MDLIDQSLFKILKCLLPVRARLDIWAALPESWELHLAEVRNSLNKKRSEVKQK